MENKKKMFVLVCYPTFTRKFQVECLEKQTNGIGSKIASCITATRYKYVVIRKEPRVDLNKKQIKAHQQRMRTHTSWL